MDRAPNSLHESMDADGFLASFHATTGRTIEEVVDQFVSPHAPKAVFAVGSLTLGMGSSGSDVDLIVLVDDRSALVNDGETIANSARELQFNSADRALLAGIFLSMHAGVLVDLHVALTPEIHRIYERLRHRGPELSETEIRTLGRLSSGWPLHATSGYLDKHSQLLRDPALPIYCCTKQFVSALHELAKARRAAASGDIPLALHHWRLSIEAAYLAYFASEELTYLGTKWLAQLGQARSAAQRVGKYPLLATGIPLLFPSYPMDPTQTEQYLHASAQFIRSIRELIERKTLFRIAFNACAQIHPV
jgi:hypothetical protein